MRQRPENYLRTARRKLEVAEALLGAGFPEEGAADAYFAMLAGAHGALADRGHFAKTHHGTWTLFALYFIRTGLVEKSSYDEAQDAMEFRTAADYEGGGADAEQARVTIDNARSFIEIVSVLIRSPDEAK